MKHIRQKDSSFNSNEAYSVVITTDWNNPLEEHPSIVEHPEVFEIADCNIPNNAQYLNYISDGN